MNSFNVYRQTSETIGGNTPVWLGTVKPIPVGACVDGVGSNEFYPAGSLVEYDATDKLIVSVFTAIDSSEINKMNGYLYNDVRIADENGGPTATCAVVMHHPEGLLIERVYPEITEEQIQALQAKIPGVLLVRG